MAATYSPALLCSTIGHEGFNLSAVVHRYGWSDQSGQTKGVEATVKSTNARIKKASRIN